MKRYLFSLFVSVLAVFVVASPALGISYPDGQQHYYSVLMRGNGEAIVSFKAHLSNITEQTVNTITLQVPSGTIADVSAYQVYTRNYQPPCYQPYESEIPQVTPTPQSLESDTTYPSGTSSLRLGGYAIKPIPCRAYPDYDYNSYGSQYQKADVSVSGQTVTVTLPNSILPGQDGNYFLTYRTNGLAHKTMFGAFAFTFETLKIDAAVSDLQIGIATDDSYILKDAKGNINYNGTSGVSKAMPAISSVGGVNNTALDTYYNQIGQGTIYKTAAHLSPNESYTVSGMYADSSWKLYGREIGFGLFVIIFVVFFVMLLVRRLLRHPAVHTKLSVQQSTLVYSLGISFVTSLLVAGYTVILFFLGKFGNMFMPYYFDGQVIIVLLMAIVFVGMYGILLLSPAIFWGIKRGVWWGVGVFGLTIVWLTGYIVIAVVVSYLVFQPSQYISPPMPMGAPEPVNQSSSVESGSTITK